MIREAKVAELAQTLKDTVRKCADWRRVSPFEREEIERTLTRIANQCVLKDSDQARSIDDCTPAECTAASQAAMSTSWQAWHGGVCPVPHGTHVDLKLRGGSTCSTSLTSSFRWSHTGEPGDIIAWRLFDGSDPVRENDDGWQGWDGGPCPLPAQTRVDIKLSSGASYFKKRADSAFAGDWSAVVAYRLAK